MPGDTIPAKEKKAKKYKPKDEQPEAAEAVEVVAKNGAHIGLWI